MRPSNFYVTTISIRHQDFWMLYITESLKQHFMQYWLSLITYDNFKAFDFSCASSNRKRRKDKKKYCLSICIYTMGYQLSTTVFVCITYLILSYLLLCKLEKGTHSRQVQTWTFHRKFYFLSKQKTSRSILLRFSKP